MSVGFDCVSPCLPPDSVSQENIWFDAGEGFLYIDFRRSCRTMLRVGNWTRGLTVERWNIDNCTWVREDSDPGLPIPFSSGTSASVPFETFAADIPRELKTVLRPFGWRQYVLLRMARIDFRSTLDLLSTNPALTFLWADSAAVNEMPSVEAASVLCRKRREILAYAGGPESESAVKLLSRITAGPDTGFFDQKGCRELRVLIASSDLLRKLRHFARIPISIIEAMNRRPCMALWLLRTGTAITPEVRQIWSDTVGIGQRLGLADPVQYMRKCSSAESLGHLHATWVGKYWRGKRFDYRREFLKRYGTLSFPPPPLRASSNIEPITTFDELQDEAREMHNCVYSYAEKIMGGDCYIYRVKFPERATLEIALMNNAYISKQLKTIKNGDPGMETRNAVADWLRETQKCRNESPDKSGTDV